MPGILAQRLQAAFSTLPDGDAWPQAGLALLLLALVLLPLGFATGFFKAGLPKAPPGTLAGIALISLLFPALAEETIFRVLLLPHPTEAASTGGVWFWAVASLTVFVASHVVKIGKLSPAKRAVFRHPVFLLFAGLLGTVCTILYLRTGSVWPPAAVHYLAVIVWLLILGGYEKLYP